MNNRIKVMDLPILPENLNDYCLTLDSVIPYNHSVSKTHNEVWGVVVSPYTAYQQTFLLVYRKLLRDEFGYGG